MGICFFKTSFVLSNSVLNTIEFMLTIRVCFFLLTYVLQWNFNEFCLRMIWSWTTKWCSKYFRYIKVIEPHKQFCKIAYIWWNGWLGPVSYWIWKLIFWLFRYLFKGLELLNNSLILKCLCELPPLTLFYIILLITLKQNLEKVAMKFGCLSRILCSCKFSCINSGAWGLFYDTQFLHFIVYTNVYTKTA